MIDCRNRAGIEKCETRYGAWKGAQVSGHLLAGVLIVLTYKVKHTEEANGDRFKTWPFLPLATAAGFSYMAANQASKEPDATHCAAGKRFNGFACE